MNILGISAYYHDSAACLVQDGQIRSAAQEERFTRIKHDASFPENAVAWCLEEAGLQPGDIDFVAFYDKPFLKFERILQTHLAFAPKGFRAFLMAIPLWIREKIWIKDHIAQSTGYGGPILFPEHHESHAASAFYPSPFDRAAFLTIDGVGEWTTTSYGVGEGNHIAMHGEIHFPHSLGLLYSAFTYYTGFKVNSGEYKVMGLAPYGEPKYAQTILDELIDLREDGSFQMNMNYFNYCAGLTMTNRRFDDLFGGPPRKQESRLTQREMDLARSVQEVTEEAMLRMGRHVHRETGCENLCLAGGVALNCVANGRLLREGPFDRLWIQPAAGDAGGAIGAALYAWHQHQGKPRTAGPTDSQRGSYLGPHYSSEDIRAWLDAQGYPYTRIEDEDAFSQSVAQRIADEKVVGWFQGPMEFGPRALGGRSILGDPRSPRMQETMNLKIKFRESFRPFAPSVLAEDIAEYFEQDCESPYMLLVAGVREELRKPMTETEQALFGIDKLNVCRSTIPAVTHVDYSARIQTVHEDTNPRYHRLLTAFKALTGCAVLINTSFNVRGEPIVCTPQDAYRCFMRTNMDCLVLEDCILEKAAQPPLEDDVDWRAQFELD
ncbi:MAG: carbamoyltransferase [Candidatus Hydrogenedentes bacterium]|nr:carbamoyltransferase [Candidatus Hydrogenedentota bacterium]